LKLGQKLPVAAPSGSGGPPNEMPS